MCFSQQLFIYKIDNDNIVFDAKDVINDCMVNAITISLLTKEQRNIP